MQSKVIVLLLLSAPMLAQDADTPATPVTSEPTAQVNPATPAACEPVAQPVAQSEPDKNMNPTCISVEFKLAKKDASVDKETWKKFKKMLIDCHKLAKDKQFEQAMALFDQLATTKPAGIMGNITINANQQISRAAEQAGVASPAEKKVKGTYTKVMCEIYKTDVSEEVWNEISTLAFEVIRPQQEVTYEKAKHVAFAIIAKS